VLGTLARQLEQLKEALPEEITLRSILQNTIRSQLAPAFERLIGYYKAANAAGYVINVSGDNYGWDIFGAGIGPFPLLYENNFSPDWLPQTNSATWADYHPTIPPDDRIFGGGLLGSLSEKLNYAAAHNLFSGVFDQFVKAYSRTIAEAKKNLKHTFTDNAAYEGKADHQP